MVGRGGYVVWRGAMWYGGGVGLLQALINHIMIHHSGIIKSSRPSVSQEVNGSVYTEVAGNSLLFILSNFFPGQIRLSYVLLIIT